LLVIIGLITFLYSLKWAGLNLFGTCSVIIGTSPYYVFFILMIYIVLAIVTLVLFKFYAPEHPLFIIQKKLFLQFYFYYILVSCILWAILALSNYFSYENCLHWHQPLWNLTITVGNISEAIFPFIIGIIRF
jgi:hypothetical protein